MKPFTPRPRRSRHLLLCFATLTRLVLATGCGGTNSETESGSGTTTTSTGSAEPCLRGAVPGVDGACMAVGLQGCADMFWEDDNLCHPSTDKCPTGTIPKFDEGCVPVGVPGCAPELAEEGMCGASMTKCPEGTFAVPQEGCRPVDGPDGCGDGTWGNLVEAIGDVNVDQSAPPGGDGSRAAPFPTIAEALSAVGTGGRVVIAAGTYDEPVKIDDAIEVVGRCASKVKITGTQLFESAPVIVLLDQAHGATLRNVEVGGEGGGIVASYAHDTTIDGVVVRKAIWSGILVHGGQVTVTHTWIHDTLADPVTGKYGYGIQAESSADLTIEHSAITASRRLSLLASLKNTSVHVEDSLIEPVLAPGDVGVRQGVYVQSKAKLEVKDSVITGAREFGIKLIEQGSTASFDHSEIHGSLAAEGTSKFGDAVDVNAGSISLVASVLSQNRRLALLAVEGAVATLDASLVAKNAQEMDEDAMYPVSIRAQSGASVTLQRCAVVDSPGSGINATGAGSVLQLEATAVERSAQKQPSPIGVYGVQVDKGARVTAGGSYFSQNASSGLVVASAGSKGALDHCLIERSVPDVDQEFGLGAVVLLGGALESAASVFQANRTYNVQVEDSGSTWLSTGDYIAGGARNDQGVTLFDQGSATLSGTVLRRLSGFGMLVYGASASLTDCRIELVLPSDVVISDQVVSGVGDGLVAVSGSKVNLAGLTVLDFARAGLLFENSEGSLSGTSVSNGPFGLVLQGQIQPALEADNHFQGTQQNVVMGGALPVPDQPAPLPAPP